MIRTATLQRALPQMISVQPFLSDAGLELVLMFREGVELPGMSAFPLLDTGEGRALLDRYAEPYLALAREHGVGFVHETPTWRGSWGWTGAMGFSMEKTAELNRLSIRLGRALAERNRDVEIVVSGNIGPQGDGYAPERMLTAEEAEAYHAHQVRAFAEAGADLVTAMTITHAGEATGIARAARAAGLPAVISFTVETDGRLPSGQPLGEAVEEVDGETGGHASYFGINCAHPDHFLPVVEAGGGWLPRIGMVRANASRMSHAELDNAEELDDGDPEEMGVLYGRLQQALPNLYVLGGCCGTDHRHVREIAGACLH